MKKKPSHHGQKVHHIGRETNKNSKMCHLYGKLPSPIIIIDKIVFLHKSPFAEIPLRVSFLSTREEICENKHEHASRQIKGMKMRSRHRLEHRHTKINSV